MKIALVQFNPVVGDIANNARNIVERVHEAAQKGANLVVFPELALIGYSHHDLLDNAYVVDGIEDALAWIHRQIPQHVAAVIGTVVRNPSQSGKKLYNSAAFLESGHPVQYVHKMLLPTYDVYD